ncbi:MAG: MFS transporter [Desulfobacterales bacterium]
MAKTEHIIRGAGRRFYGRKLVFILFVTNMVVLGMGFYGFTVIFPAMVKETGWGRGEASLAATLRPVFLSLAMPLAAAVINRSGTRRSIMIGLAILGSGMLLLATATTALWQWTLIWGVFLPFGFAFFNLGTQTTVTFWYNLKRATTMGIVMTGTSIGGFLATPVFTRLIQKTGNWQSAWMACAILVSLMVLLSLKIYSKPSDLGQFPDNISPEIQDGNERKKRRYQTFRTSRNWRMRQILKTRSLYCITFGQIACTIPLQVLVTHMVLHLTDLGYTEMEAASVMSIVVLSSGFARFPMGWVGDRIEPRWLISVSLLVIMAMVYNVWKAPSLPALLAGGVVYGFSYGTILVLLPVMRGNYFGPDAFANLAGVITPLTLVFVAPAPYLAGYMADTFGNYDPAFIGIFAVLAAGVVCMVIAAPPEKQQNDAQPAPVPMEGPAKS